eukprot:279642-Pelagomonas_calceolata.AAC.1
MCPRACVREQASKPRVQGWLCFQPHGCTCILTLRSSKKVVPEHWGQGQDSGSAMGAGTRQHQCIWVSNKSGSALKAGSGVPVHLGQRQECGSIC